MTRESSYRVLATLSGPIPKQFVTALRRTQRPHDFQQRTPFTTLGKGLIDPSPGVVEFAVEEQERFQGVNDLYAMEERMAVNGKPTVSVIIPAYNAQAFIEETLKSVQQQTYSNLEILVVDDGSKDCTSAIVERYAQNDQRIKLYSQKNQGVAAPRILAIARSTGKFIAPI